MLKYNNMFTHTYIYYSEGKSKLNNKNDIDKHNTKSLIVVCLFIHSSFIYSVRGSELNE